MSSDPGRRGVWRRTKQVLGIGDKIMTGLELAVLAVCAAGAVVYFVVLGISALLR